MLPRITTVVALPWQRIAPPSPSSGSPAYRAWVCFGLLEISQRFQYAHDAVIRLGVLLLEPRQEPAQLVELRNSVQIDEVALGRGPARALIFMQAISRGSDSFTSASSSQGNSRGVAIREETHLRLPDAQMGRLQVPRQDREPGESFHLAKDCIRIE